MNKFKPEQVECIIEGMRSDIDYSIYAKPEYNYKQMKVFLEILKYNKINNNKINISLFEDKYISSTNMKYAFEIFKKGFNLNLNLKEISIDDMKKIYSFSSQKEIDNFIDEFYKQEYYQLVSVSVKNFEDFDKNNILNCIEKNTNKKVSIYFDNNDFKKVYIDSDFKNVIYEPKKEIEFNICKKDIEKVKNFEHSFQKKGFYITHDSKDNLLIKLDLPHLIFNKTKLYQKIEDTKNLFEKEEIKYEETLSEIIERFEREKEKEIYIQKNKNNILYDNWLDVKNKIVDKDFWTKFNKEKLESNNIWEQYLDNLSR